MILMQTDRNLFLNEDLVYVLPGRYVEVGQKWLMAICSERFQGPIGPTCSNTNIMIIYCRREWYAVVCDYVVV